jgi:predicted phage terminase large subunit-like protein
MRPFLYSHPKAKENRLHAAGESYKWFFNIYLSHYMTLPSAPFHLESFKRAREERVLEIWPRTYGKSVIWSIGYPLWVILNNPYELDMKWKKEDLFCLSNTAKLAEKWLRYHKRELLENSRIQGDYEVTPGKIWRNDEIEVTVRGVPHGRIVGLGAGAQIRGEHPTEVVIDDLENREEQGSEGPREKMREYFYQDVWGAFRQEEGHRTRAKIVGTFVHPLGLLPELYQKDWWKVKSRYAVYKPDGTPLWPEYMDDEALRVLRSQIPETAWASEYMNAPIVSENPLFRRETFRGYEPGTLRDGEGKLIGQRDMLIVTAIDPAISQRDAGDYSALVTVGATWGDEPKIFTLDAQRGHWLTSRQINELIAAYQRFPGSKQLIETTAYQKSLYHQYRDRLDREGLDIAPIAVEPDKDKGVRAHAVTHLFQAGMVHFDYSDKMQQILMDELALFDYTKRKHGRDDFVDAMVYALTYIDEWLRRKKRQKRGAKRGLNLLWEPRSPIYGAGVR